MDVTLSTLATGCSFQDLRGLSFEQRSVVFYGKPYEQPRLTLWYGPVAYTYSGLTWEPRPMPELVQKLCGAVEGATGGRFNCVVLNFYRTGADTVGWHSDDEALFGTNPEVASLSFGASREFQMRLKSDRSVKKSYDLGEGSLLYMGRGIQEAWQHRIPPTKKPVGERINLTFRYVP